MPTYTEFIGDGTEVNFTYAFPLIKDEFLVVEVAGVEKTVTTDYTINTATEVLTFTTAPVNGDLIVIKRDSDVDTALVDFQKTSRVTEAALDLSYEHNRNLIQELYHRISNTLIQTLKTVGTKVWNMGGLKVTNVATPTEDTDAVTKAYVDTTFESETGPAGADGADGSDGADGADGSDGADGAAGTQWLNGSSAPSSEQGVTGDFFFNSTTNKIYKKTDSTTWAEISDVDEGIVGHTGSSLNPHSVTKDQVGLGNVDNTSDANKPSNLTVKDEGTDKTTSADSINFVGSGVTATNSGEDVTVTIGAASGTAFKGSYVTCNNASYYDYNSSGTFDNYSVAHGLGSAPDEILFQLKCTTTEYGYSVDDVITGIGHDISDYYSGGSGGHQAGVFLRTCWADDTNIYVKWAFKDQFATVTDATSEDQGRRELTPANWSFRVIGIVW